MPINEPITKFSGVWTALVTPMNDDGSIDFKSFEKVIKRQIDGGITGVIPNGTTGESATLTLDEKKEIIRFTLDFCKGTDTYVMPGTGSNSTAESIELSTWASDNGADAILVVTPYYNKPSQAGLESHYNAIANAVQCPVMLYNVPSRTGVSLTARTVAHLSKHPRIRSIKEATGNPGFASEIIDQCTKLGTSIDILSGDDATFLSLMAIGSNGVVSVTSNFFASEMVQLYDAWASNDIETALAFHAALYPCFRDLFVESNPVPIKDLMHMDGICGAKVRAPLAPLQAESRTILKRAYDQTMAALSKISN